MNINRIDHESVGTDIYIFTFRFRFFSNGRVLMVLSHNPPSKILHKLQTREKAPFNVCPGHYQLSGNQLFVTLDSEDNDRQQEINKKIGWKDNTQRKTTYKMVCHVETLNIVILTVLNNYVLTVQVLTISTHKCKLNWKLRCTNYEVVYQSRVNRVMVTKYNLTNNRFPPFIFSRVKCYANESECIL